MLTIGSDLDLPAMLHRIIASATDLVDARYGALGVLDDTGSRLAQFITVGIDDETHRRIGDLPAGHGILGLLNVDAKPLRLRSSRCGGVPARPEPDAATMVASPAQRLTAEGPNEPAVTRQARDNYDGRGRGEARRSDDPDETADLALQRRAPGAIADLCHVDVGRRGALKKQVEVATVGALRVLAVARARFSRSEGLPVEQHDLVFEYLGLAGVHDPVRPGVVRRRAWSPTRSSN